MKLVAALSIAGVFFLLPGHAFGQQQNTTPVSFDKVVPVSAESQADTLNVIVNTPKKISEEYSVPVPVQQQNSTAPVITNPAKKENDPY